LTSNDIDPRIFSIEKTKKFVFFHFFRKETSNIISELNDDFSDDFFEVFLVGFRDLVGTGIAPVSKKTAVNRKPSYWKSLYGINL
jgi:hypothetical protein